MRFHSGAVGEIHMDYVQRAPSRSCQVIGDEGTLRWEGASSGITLVGPSQKDKTVFSMPQNWEPNRMYRDEIKHFLRCVRTGSRTGNDVDEASRVLALALAAKRSSARRIFVRMGEKS
jgi:predicted dehydrogenase